MTSTEFTPRQGQEERMAIQAIVKRLIETFGRTRDIVAPWVALQANAAQDGTWLDDLMATLTICRFWRDKATREHRPITSWLKFCDVYQEVRSGRTLFDIMEIEIAEAEKKSPEKEWTAGALAVLEERKALIEKRKAVLDLEASAPTPEEKAALNSEAKRIYWEIVAKGNDLTSRGYRL